MNGLGSLTRIQVIWTQVRMLVLAAFILSLSNQTAEAAGPTEEWTFPNVALTSVAPTQFFSFYVPKEHAFSDIVLEMTLESLGPAQLFLALGDQPASQLRIIERDTIRVPFEQVEEGFHRFQLSGISSRVLDRQNQVGECTEQIVPSVRIKNARMTYEKVLPEEPKIAHLPDPLLNPNKFTGEELTIGLLLDVDADAEWQRIVAEAARVSLFEDGAPRRIRWIPYVVSSTIRFDAVVEFIQIQELGDTGRLSINVPDYDPSTGELTEGSLPVPRITFEFGSEIGLRRAVNAVLNEEIRRQIQSSTATISHDVLPGEFRTRTAFNSLFDLGLPDQEIAPGTEVSASVTIPNGWVTTGAMTGNIALRVPDGLPNGSGFQVWVNGTLAGSHRLDQVGSDNVAVNIPVTARISPRSKALHFVFRPSVTTPGGCTPMTQARIWLDSETSRIDLPYVVADGLMGLPENLAARPVLRIPGRDYAAVTSLLMTMTRFSGQQSLSASSYQFLIGDSVEEDADPTLSVTIDPAEFEQLMQSNSDVIYDLNDTSGVFYMFDQDRFRLVATTGGAFGQLASKWDVIWGQLEPNMTAAYLTNEGIVIPLKSGVIPNAPVRERVFAFRNYATFILLIVGIIAVLVYAFLTRRRKDGAG